MRSRRPLREQRLRFLAFQEWKHMRRYRTTCIILASIAILIADGSQAQSYPTKPIRIVTFNVGGGNDFTARLIGQGLNRALGQPVIIDNRAGGVIPGEVVAKSAPDGYTLLVAGVIYSIGFLMQDTPYDPLRDFEPISTVGASPLILVVHTSIPVRSVSDLIALAKAKPGQLNYANGGFGGGTHLASELFKTMAGGLNIVRIDYRAAGPAVLGLTAGECGVMFAQSSTVAPFLRSGKLRALGVTSNKPSALAPELPAISATLPGFEADYWSLIVAPAKTPASIISMLNREVVRTIEQPDVKQKFLSVGVDANGSTPEQAVDAIKAEIARMSPVIKAAGIHMD
jgi:tripartite-type tricarboxylate transporter receptor subunit TctC